MTQNEEVKDLRVRRTRKLLREALLDLATEKGFDAITVNDLTERAMINRATFYRHYRDKYELALAYATELLDELGLLNKPFSTGAGKGDPDGPHPRPTAHPCPPGTLHPPPDEQRDHDADLVARTGAAVLRRADGDLAPATEPARRRLRPRPRPTVTVHHRRHQA